MKITDRQFDRTGVSGFYQYVAAFAAVLLVVAACYPIGKLIGYQAIGLIFLMVIALLSLVLGRGPVFLAAILSSAVWNFFFIPPVLTFHIHQPHDVIALVANLMVALVGATLITRIRNSRADLLQSRRHLQAVNHFLESLNNATSIKEVVSHAAEGFQAQFGAGIVIFLREIGGQKLSGRPFGDGTLFGDTTFGLACSTYSNQGHTDNGFFPLQDARGTFGVIGIRFDGNRLPGPEEKLLINSFIAQVTSALEREISVDIAKQQEIFQESDKLFGTILNSVSHELRTPIAVITAAVSNLQDPVTCQAPEAVGQIIAELGPATDRLNILVANFLDMSRIESGRMKLNLHLCDPEDLTGTALRTLGQEIGRHPLEVVAGEGIPPVMADANLLVQALINVIHNACTYSPDGAPLSVRISSGGDGWIAIRIADRGPGVPEPVLARIFEKFYRVPGSRSGGTGLGLAITHAIVEAHGGKVTACNLQDGGLEITIHLRAEKEQPNREAEFPGTLNR